MRHSRNSCWSRNWSWLLGTSEGIVEQAQSRLYARFEESSHLRNQLQPNAAGNDRS